MEGESHFDEIINKKIISDDLTILANIIYNILPISINILLLLFYYRNESR